MYEEIAGVFSELIKEPVVRTSYSCIDAEAVPARSESVVEANLKRSSAAS